MRYKKPSRRRSIRWWRSSAAQKISTKLNIFGHLLSKVETLIIGGGMANTFLAAQGKPSASRCARHV